MLWFEVFNCLRNKGFGSVFSVCQRAVRLSNAIYNQALWPFHYMLNLPRTIELQPCSHVSLTCCWHTLRNTNFACSIYSCGFLVTTHFKVVFFIKCFTSWSCLLLTIKMMNEANYYGTSQHRRCDGSHLHPDWFCLTLPSLLCRKCTFLREFLTLRH